jgi:hypothetical protein
MGTTCLRREKHDETLNKGSDQRRDDGWIEPYVSGRGGEGRPMITATRQSRIRETVLFSGFFVSLGDNVTARSKVAQVQKLRSHCCSVVGVAFDRQWADGVPSGHSVFLIMLSLPKRGDDGNSRISLSPFRDIRTRDGVPFVIHHTRCGSSRPSRRNLRVKTLERVRNGERHLSINLSSLPNCSPLQVSILMSEGNWRRAES